MADGRIKIHAEEVATKIAERYNLIRGA
jgi:hypothetical protein